LRAGKSDEAARSFAASCGAAGNEAFAEDACFWTGVAAKRAGQTRIAREALTRFLAKFPTSGRAAEASALLGWELYDAGDLDGAERWFRRPRPEGAR
jgi:TolA-binding protein